MEELLIREREILRLLGAGETPAQIADELSLAEASVVWYIRRLVARLGPQRFDTLAAELASEAPRLS